jgi:hypothetical protein
MITTPMDVLANFEIRKSKKQKTAFIHATTAYAQRCGYTSAVENGKFGSRNLIFGDPEKADFLVTAHYDTPASIGLPNFITPCNPVVFILWQILILIPFFAVAFLAGLLVSLVTDNGTLIFWAAYIAYFAMLALMMFGPANRHNANDNTSGVVTVLEMMSTMPENLREKVCFVLFDLEEAGLIGSSSYRKAHKTATDRQLVLNLDCVGDGDHIVLFPNKRLKQSEPRMAMLEKLTAVCGKKSIKIHRKGFAHCPSDHKHFPYGVGVMAFHRKKGLGLYCDRIHTWRDTVLERTNVNILRAAIISMIGAAEK